jgi:flagellar motor protein MotB
MISSSYLNTNIALGITNKNLLNSDYHTPTQEMDMAKQKLLMKINQQESGIRVEQHKDNGNLCVYKY